MTAPALHVCDGTKPSCLGCAAVARRMAEVRAAMTADDRLDDVTRARMWTRLEEALEARGEAAPRRRTVAWLGAPVAAAAAIVLFFALRGGGPGSSRGARALVAPPETTLTATIGGHTRAALVGPARMEVVEQAGDATTVRLERGTMYASFEGGGARRLRVVAPGAVVDVVGTLFAVDAGDDAGRGTCVSVAHGEVRVTMGARVVMVRGGGRVCSGDATPRAIEAPVQRALERHEQAAKTNAMTASAEPSMVVTAPVVAVAAPRAPVPASPPPPPAVRPERGSEAPESKSEPVAEPPESKGEPVAAPPAPAGPSDTDLYALAEDALAHHDPAAADRALAELIAIAPSSSLLDQALYERARIAYQRHAWNEARRHLDALAALPSTPLAEPGRYLACRIAVEAHDGDAARCLTDYRAAFPRSAHDQDVLGLLAQLGFEEAGCAGAQAYIDELAAQAPTAKLTAAWRARCPGAP